MESQSTVNEIDEVTKQINVSVPQERVSKEYESALVKVGKNASIKGFRPGKVPKDMVKQLLGDQVKYEVIQRLVQDGLRTAYEAHKLDVVGEPEIELDTLELTKPLEFKAKVSLFPSPSVGNYKDRVVEVVKHEVSDKDVEDAVLKTLESKARLKAIEDRKILELGDVVALSVSIKVGDGEPSRPEPFVDVLGEGKLNKTVEAQLVGATVGDERVISAQVNEESEESAETKQQLSYSIKVHGIFSKEVPELNDEFVKELGADLQTVDQFRTKIREQLQARAEESNKNEISGALLDMLAKENPFKVPEVMVDEEIRGIMSRYGFGGQNVDPSKIDIAPFRAQFEEFALNRIRCAILVDRIGEAEQIKVEEADHEAMIRRIAERDGASIEATQKQLRDRNRLMAFLQEVRRTKTLDFLISGTKVQYKPAEASTPAP